MSVSEQVYEALQILRDSITRRGGYSIYSWGADEAKGIRSESQIRRMLERRGMTLRFYNLTPKKQVELEQKTMKAELINLARRLPSEYGDRTYRSFEHAREYTDAIIQFIRGFAGDERTFELLRSQEGPYRSLMNYHEWGLVLSPFNRIYDHYIDPVTFEGHPGLIHQIHARVTPYIQTDANSAWNELLACARDLNLWTEDELKLLKGQIVEKLRAEWEDLWKNLI